MIAPLSRAASTVRTWTAALLSDRLAAAALLLGFLALYVRTAAPSVLSGDSAEFQLAAPLLGVPHPTTYPLYTLLGKLATLLIPVGDLARRVTLVSALAGALTVALLFLLARRLGAGTPAAVLAALALGLAPGLWNAATLAEVYTLLAALLAALALLLARPAADTRGLRGAAFAAGLGFSHHGLFVFTGLPLLAVAALAVVRHERLRAAPARLLALLLCFALGLMPWLFPLVQYARLGPFDGQDYGLPRHYFWGSPTSWGEVLELLAGGPLRSGALRLPTPGGLLEMLTMVAGRLWFEFGPLGCVLGLVGCAALLRRDRRAGLGALWVAAGTLLYLALLGPAVQDAPVFTLPILLPWALWVGFGGQTLADALRTKNQEPQLGQLKTQNVKLKTLSALLLAATLVWGYTRVPYANKRHLTLFRSWGQAALAQLPQGTVVIAHWEQGMLLQYLVLAERQRPDVWVDVVEPGDENWGTRVQRRYTGRPVFFVGRLPELAGLPVEQVLADNYADLFRLENGVR
ncbi:MAG TPA: DUF2723 domain-containing protein [Roseiflexaceae bacterium]|nr:DUF2723 domain-containing protein [Roseiflexaceae bacterium]